LVHVPVGEVKHFFERLAVGPFRPADAAAIATDIWEISGVPLSKLDPATVMKAEDAVDAALAGLDLGEKVTLPSVENLQLLTNYDTARLAPLGSSQSSKPATRYSVSSRA
jgi:uncharacterized protein